MEYLIECSVSGGVTGSRTSLLKNGDGAVQVFNARDVAETEATRLRSTMGRHSAATFAYTVVERDVVARGTSGPASVDAYDAQFGPKTSAAWRAAWIWPIGTRVHVPTRAGVVVATVTKENPTTVNVTAADGREYRRVAKSMITRVDYVGDPAADGVRAVKTDAAVAAAIARDDRATLATIASRIGVDEFDRRYPAARAKGGR
jgi:hypothetical protein